MKKLILSATLLQLATANASIVAIMDSGTDISHKELAPKAWVNKKEIAGSDIDNDGSGLPGDINGWDFTENSPKVFNDKYNHLITSDVKKFYNLIGKLDLGTINQMEYSWLKAASENEKFRNQADFIGSYAHGTHVAGIAAKGVAKAEVLSMKILPTEYQEVLGPVVAEPLQYELFETDTTIAQLKDQLVEVALSQTTEMAAMSGYLAHHKVDVVNQSFGIGTNQAVNMIYSAFVSTIKRVPTEAELVDLYIAYFGTLLSSGEEIFKASSETLFIVAAGNDGSDNDKLPDYPSTIEAENKIVVAATLGYSELAEFSNYGATKVEVAAPGVAINSTAPAQNYLPMSGTSQAAPFVTNAIAQVKDMNPALKALDIKKIILGTVDVKAWLAGKVATSGIVNKARAVKAAELSKTLPLDKAISQARATIADVPVQKSLSQKLKGMTLKIKPVRPSLLVKKPII